MAKQSDDCNFGYTVRPPAPAGISGSATGALIAATGAKQIQRHRQGKDDANQAGPLKPD